MLELSESNLRLKAKTLFSKKISDDKALEENGKLADEIMRLFDDNAQETASLAISEAIQRKSFKGFAINQIQNKYSKWSQLRDTSERIEAESKTFEFLYKNNKYLFLGFAIVNDLGEILGNNGFSIIELKAKDIWPQKKDL